MPDIYLTNRGDTCREGNMLIKTTKGTYEVGINRYAAIQFISHAENNGEDGPTIVYRSAKIYPSRFKKWVVAGANSYDDLTFVLFTDEQLRQKLNEILYEYVSENIDAEVMGDNDQD